MDFFQLGFGASSGLFFLPAGGVSVDLPSTHPNCFISEGSTRVGVADTGEAENRLLMLFFLPGSLGGVG